MSKKQKDSENPKKAGDAFLGEIKDPELEKKVDRLLNVEEPDLPSEPDESVEVEAPKKPPASKRSINVVDSDTEETTIPASKPVVEVEPDSAPELEEVVGGPPLLPKDAKAKKSIAVSFHEDETPAVEPATSEDETQAEPEPEPEQPVAPPELPAEEPKPEPEVPLTPAEPKSQLVSSPPPEIKPVSPDKKPQVPQTFGDDLGLEDVGTSRAVDEIIASEGDELLEARDRGLFAPDEPAPAVRGPKGNPLKRLLSAWWHNKLTRNLTLLVLLLAIAATLIAPPSRYFLLNAAGVRSSSSVVVLDETTGQPLKNAQFSVAGQSGKTDGDGKASLEKLRLGPTSMSIRKPAFAEVSQPVTIGWGSNPLGNFKLKPTGSQYSFNIKDFLSNQAIAKAEASSGDANARANDKGELVLTVPQSDQETIDVKISADGYRTETHKLSLFTKDATMVVLTPARKHVFITKRSGTFDVYKIDVDGKNEEKVLAGTGRERSEGIALSAHPRKDVAALVSTRDTLQNKDGFNLSTLTLIDLKDNSTKTVTQSERIQLIDWIDEKLIYVKIAEGASAASPNRHRLISYDLRSGNERELASTNYFNDVLAVNDAIYYSPASYNVNGTVGLYKINAEGNNRRMVYDKEVWNLFRTSYENMSVSIGQEWFDLNLKNDVMTKAKGAPTVQKSRVYVNSPNNKESLWVDDRDGKGVMLQYTIETNQDKTLQTKAGLKNPVSWLTDKHIIYRISNNTETADYIVNTEGGEPKKVRDVTDTAGIDRWYYY